MAKTGRPRALTLPPDDMVTLGKELVNWVKTNDALHISAWYAIEKGYTDNEFDAFVSKPEFKRYYEIAQKVIGMKYLDKRSNVRESLSGWATIYFKDYKKHKEEALSFKAELDKKQKQEDEQHYINQVLGAIKDSENTRDAQAASRVKETQ